MTVAVGTESKEAEAKEDHGLEGVDMTESAVSPELSIQVVEAM